jgi:hypothetical protein
VLRLALLLAALCLPALYLPVPSRAAEPPQTPMLRVEAAGHLGAVPRLSLDRSGRLLATASYDKTVRLWSLDDGAQLAVLRVPIGDGEEGELYAVAMTPDGRRVYAAGATGGQWDGTFSVYAFSTERARLEGALPGFPAPVNDLAVSPDGSRLAIGLAAGGIRVWEIGGAIRQIFEDRNYAGPVRAVAWGGHRLFAAAADGRVRAYDVPGSQAPRKLAESQPASGLRPWGLAASPDGGLVAVTYENAMRVDVLNAATLATSFRPDTSGLAGEGLLAVAWSSDGCCGAQLLAAGYARAGERRVIRRWADYGMGTATDVPAARDTILALAPIPGGGAVFGTEDPGWGRLSPDGQVIQPPRPPMADLRPSREGGLAVNRDGTVVEFATANGRLRFDAPARRLGFAPDLPDPRLTPARVTAPGLQAEGWRDGSAPHLNGVALTLGRSEIARSLAVMPGGGVLLGTDTWLRLYARNGHPIVETPVPAAAWALAVSADARVAVAALLDGTLRWYGLDGPAPLRPLAALFASADGERWVLYTPEGLFDHADTGGQTLVGIHLNRGRNQRPEWTTLSQAYRTLYAPAAVLARLRGDPAPASARLNELGDLRQRLSRQPGIDIALACVPQADASCTALAASRGTATVLPPNATRLRLKLRAEDRGLGMGPVDVFVNDRNAGRFSPPGSPGIRAETTVEVPLDTGENIVQVRLYDGAGTVFAEAAPLRLAAPAEIQEQPQDPARKGRLFVLAVGINRFVRPELTLASAATDAQDFAGLIRRTAAPLFRGVEVTTLLDQEATRLGILTAMERVAAVAQANDTFLFYAASHGVRDAATGRFLLVPHDAADPAQEGAFVRSALDETTLVTALSRIRARDALLLLDTCHAGQVAIDGLAGVGQETGRYLLAASGSLQEALDSYDGRNGVFLVAMREALQGRAPQDRDGVVEALSFGDYVSRRVGRLAQERGHVQDAVFRTARHDLRSFPVGVAEPPSAAAKP